MPLTLFHTAQVHCETFDALRDRIAPELELVHHVRPDWLERAQGGVTPSLQSEIAHSIQAVQGKTICTCTTIGAMAESAGALRIDQPLMHAAAQTHGAVLLAYCLDSTKNPSLSLLQSALDAAGNPALVHLLPLPNLWPLFEAGDLEAFARHIANDVRTKVRSIETPGCVVLAQASMATAAPLLSDLHIPVLASPELVFRAALD